MQRRDFLKTGLAGGLALSFGGTLLPIGMPGLAMAQAKMRQTFMTPGYISLLHAYLFTAIEEGFLRDEGLEIVIQTGSGTAASMTQVSAGTAMFGQAAPIASCPVIADQGAEMITVGQIAYVGTFQIASSPNKPINHPRDLVGKRIGLVSKGGSSELLLDAMMRSAGLDPNSFTRAVTGLSTAGLAFVERGELDCFFVYFESKVALQLQGVTLNYMALDDFVRLPGDAVIVSSKALQNPQNEEAVVRYLRAINKGMTVVRDPKNEDRVLDYFVKHNAVQGADRTRNRATLVELRKFFNPPAGTQQIICNDAEWEQGVRLLESIGLVKKQGLPASTYYTNKYALQALKA